MLCLNVKSTLMVCAIAGAPVWAQRPERAGYSERPEWESHRVVESARQGAARPHIWVRGASLTPAIQPFRSPGGLYPLDIAAAYGLNSLGGNNGGVGVTIAIIDAYDAPNAEADLATFSTHFSLPACTSKNGCFSKVGQTGGAVPIYNAGWEVEISLDIQWAHAIAPNAKILLVEATNSNLGNLFLAVAYAKQHAQVVSMSWGGSEFNGQSVYDSYFAQPGVAFLASAGDVGGAVEYPSSSKNVVAVGGTSLALSPSGGVASPITETAWSSTGGGCSVWEPAFSPAIQKGFVPNACVHRGVVDVAMNADPNSGVAIWVSNLANPHHGWLVAGGTSLACPIWAGLIAIADSMRGPSRPISGPALLTHLYAAAGTALSYNANYRDITNGKAGALSAGPGWDFLSGLGSPKAQDLVQYLVSQP